MNYDNWSSVQVSFVFVFCFRFVALFALELFAKDKKKIAKFFQIQTNQVQIPYTIFAQLFEHNLW
jgi:hypothetical protein